MGSFVAQELRYASRKGYQTCTLWASCGGKEGIPQSPQIVKMTRDLTNTIVNNTSIDPQELKTFLSLQYGARWMKLHPNYLETIPFQNSHNSKICSMVFLIILHCSSSNLYKAGWQRTGVAFVIMFQRYPIPLWS